MHERCSVCAGVVVAWLVWSEAALASQSAIPISGAPGGQITFTGRAVDAQGTPVSGAKVTLHQITYVDPAASPQVELHAEKTTGADGAFTLTAAKDAGPYGLGFILVRKEGLALNWTLWRMQGDQRLDFTLGQGKDLAGDVTDEKGQPLAAAQVSVALALLGRIQDQRYLMSWGNFQPLAVQTDRNGHFVFANMPVEATFELLVKKAGRATISTLDPAGFRGEKGQFSPGQSGIKVVLPPEATIKGIVVENAGGKPVGGVKVGVSEPRGGPTISDPATSGPDGVFQIGGLSAGSYQVQLSGPGGQKAEWVAEPVPVSVQAGEAKSGIKLQLGKGGIIEILVKDSAGQPVEKASVSLRPLEGRQFVGAPTDAGGLARLRVAPGRYVFSGAYKQGFTRSPQTPQEQLAVEEGQTKRLEYVLQAAPKITGTVRDQAGHPLAGVKIEVKPMGGPTESTTDAQGKFEVSWDPRMWGSQTPTLMLVARDEAHNLAQVVEIEEQTTHQDLTLVPGGIVTGLVVDEAGQPLAGAHVRVMLLAGRWGSSLGRGNLATAGADGRFEIKALPPEQRYTVTATAEGYGKRDVPVNPGAMTDNRFDAGRFQLVRATLPLAGVVVDANDKPVARAFVNAYGNDQPDSLNAQTDAEGKFTFKGVCPGTIRLNVNSSGTPYRYGYTQAEGGATDLRIVISERPTGQPYQPRRPAPLKGKPLPPLKDLGIEPPSGAEGKMLLVCFWDMGQRPSRACMTQLAAQAAQLSAKGVLVVPVHAAPAEGGALSQWLETNKVSFQVGTIAGDLDKTEFAWGVSSLPHLILTDKKHTVVAEGFGLSDLDQQIETVVGR